MKRTLVMTMLGAMAVAFSAQAETLYKLIDKNGRVTYSEEKPKQFDGQVIRLDIDPNATTVTLPKPPPGGFGAAAAREKAAPAAQAKARLEGAQDRLERAKAALQNAKDNPGPNDFEHIGNVGGGTRPVASEAYLQRISALEQEVRNAEQAVQTLEKSR